VLWCLHALGGEATLGDLLAVTGHARDHLERALDSLMAQSRAHVRVLDQGDVTYHVGQRPGRRGLRPFLWPRSLPSSELVAARRAAFDRKTLRLIRTRDGVLGLAELVEQTGLPLRDAEAEMRRLAESWGGEAHLGLDGHTVYAFPLLMDSVHGRFVAREPRPAWVRSEDPMDHARGARRRARAGVVILAAGALLLLATPLLLATQGSLGNVGAGVATALAALLGATLAAVGARGVLRYHPRFRFRQQATLRRYALGYVVETALAGKGVVSLARTVRFIQGRAGKRRVSRKHVEAALRDLAEDFGAPVTTEGGDVFFGFRTVKRQFLASYLVRRQLALGRKVAGETVFDTADGPATAEAREMALFDRELGGSVTDVPAP
jgi:hypothetical protein